MLDYLLLTIYISEKILKSPGQKTHANQFHEFFFIIIRGHLQTMWTAEGGGGVPKMSMFVHMGGGGV